MGKRTEKKSPWTPIGQQQVKKIATYREFEELELCARPSVEITLRELLFKVEGWVRDYGEDIKLIISPTNEEEVCVRLERPVPGSKEIEKVEPEG